MGGRCLFRARPLAGTNIRGDCAKHWDDHSQAHGVEVEWHERDAASREKVRRFLEAPHIGPFGCGTERTFAEYEDYAGLSFWNRTAEEATSRGDEPSEPLALCRSTPEREWCIRIVLDRSMLPPEALADPLFWYVGFHDADNSELHREDVSADELREMLHGDARELVIERRFRPTRQPVTWTVWPTNSAGEWLGKVVGVATPLPLNLDGRAA
jgi:hypothetical protein